MAALAALVGLGTVTIGAQAETGANATARYIVKLSDAPLASYRGGVAGLAPTNPATLGTVELDTTSASSRAYLSYLADRQTAARADIQRVVGHSIVVEFTYKYAYNGLTAVLTETEAAAVARLSGVAKVQRDFERRIVTDAGPAWIGAPAIWSGSQTGGLPGTKGEGVVVGVIDTGVNHDHPSFADVGGDGFNHSNPRGRFFGLCDPVLGTPFCNDKLIGVYDFTGTSPLDDNGHGSHTASTSAGNAHAATINAPTLSLTRQISGVAPHANLITYKACLAIGSCVGASLTLAIDQATADGVDVINYSIGGGPNDPWNDSDSEAFLNAREAGVFVSASAGNDGPGAETVGSPANAPWLLSVGASTHNRAFVNSLTSMSGGSTAPPADIQGKSFTSGYGPAAIVHAADFGDRQCLSPFAPGTFSGEIVICERGVNPRVEKGRNVEVGGAGGMVLANSEAEGESTIADPHELPAVHIGFQDAQVLEAWVRDGGSGHTATIAGTTADTSSANGDVMAGFSSRGPNKPAPDILKPDVSAPGVDILAAVHTTNPAGPPEYGVLSGTSMSSPHSAGSAALVRALHPNWTPAEVQSALMTTALNTTMRKEDGARAADAFDMGAGRIDLNNAGRAGLILDEEAADYLAANPDEGGDPTTLNLASLADADCDATCSWTRVLKSGLGSSATWSVKTSGPRNLKLTVEPRRFTLAPGATQTITVTADVAKLPVRKWVFGQVTLTASGAPAAHLPLVVQPGGAPDPVDIETASASGSHTISYTPSIDIKELQSVVSGLAEGRIEERMLEQDPTNLLPYDTSVGTFSILVDVPAGSRFLATEIVETTSNDLDLFVGIDADGDGGPDEAEEVCRSASEIALESCRLPNPDGGKYWIMVQNWLTGQGVDEVKLVASVIPGTDNGNLTVSGPKSATAGTPFDLTFAWNEPGLDPGETWFALVELGSDKQHRTNVGSLLVKLTRTES